MKKICFFILTFCLCSQNMTAETISSGSCGDDVTYSLDETGVLAISGTGAMADGNASWYSNSSLIQMAVIEEGVTSIGSGAFNGCRSLTSVTIPDGVTRIGESAFSGCSGLTSITIPNSVTSIGDAAFANTGLTSIIIPSSVASIGSQAFAWCKGLTSVTLGNGVTSLGYYAFYGTPWYDNQPDGVIYAGKVLYEYKGAMPKNTSITVQEGTIAIAEDAFFICSGLTSVTIPNSVTSIGKSAFSGCSGLTSVIIGNGVTSIGSNAFEDCTGLTEIHSKRPTPPSIDYSDTFDGVPKATCRVYVPQGAIAAYQAAGGWSAFTYILEEGGSGEPEPVPGDTVTVKDSVVYNIIYKDSVVYNIITEDSIRYNITEKDSIHYNIKERDSVHYNITEKDSVHYNIEERDSIHYNITEKDSIKYNIIKVDSVVYDIIHKDSIDYTLVPDTVYIPMVTDITGAEHVVTANARVSEAGDGILIQGLEPNAEFNIYTVKGEKYATGIADAAGEYRLSAIDDGLYILFFRDKAGKGQYSKFYHRKL